MLGLVKVLRSVFKDRESKPLGSAHILASCESQCGMFGENACVRLCFKILQMIKIKDGYLKFLNMAKGELQRAVSAGQSR